MNGKIVYEDIYVSEEDVYNFFGNDYQPFAQPSQLRHTNMSPKDYALLLPDYIRLDGTKELLIIE